MRIAAFLILTLLPMACHGPDPAARNEVLAEGDSVNRVVLDGDDRARAVAIIRDATRVPDPEYPTPAPRGVRWSDVPAAASAAAYEVQMAVVRGANLGKPGPGPRPDPDGYADWDADFLAKPPASLVGNLADRRERWVFEVKTLRDERGWLVVVRDPSAPYGEIGPTAAAIGVVGERTSDANALLKSFAKNLRALGAKPGFKAD